MIKHWTITLIWLLTLSQTFATLENTTCKKCHPVIFSEYQSSMHSHASIYKDPIHKAVWDKHPAKAKGNYKCAKCHTPSDHNLIKGKHALKDNAIQQQEPISCKFCHTIQSIEKHAKANKNILTEKKKYFYSADTQKKGMVVKFKEERSMFGLFTKVTGSPYHTIDYGNENYYNGDMCLGCHAHKQSGKGFTVCDMEIKQGDSKESCISCHMPKIKGSLANQKQSDRHAYHGINIHKQSPKHLSQYVKLDLKQQPQGFEVLIKNEATHTLFPQPLRLNQLRVSIEREGKTIDLPTESFVRVIGKEGKPSMPWLATEVLKDSTIKALETRRVSYDTPLQKGDSVVVTFGYHIVNPKAAKKLGIDDTSATEFIVLTKKRFSF